MKWQTMGRDGVDGIRVQTALHLPIGILKKLEVETWARKCTKADVVIEGLELYFERHKERHEAFKKELE